MQSFQPAVRNPLLRIEAARTATGDSRGGFYAKVVAGLMVKPLKIGARAAAVPAYEIEAINAARIAGLPDSSIRALVKRLHAERVQVGA